ncbi:hypothetical protein DACRYDRAFT_47457, partial [Dacryopinax primogenitus]
DVTKDFGSKWKNIFIHMETYLELDIALNSHMWLLHYLFLRDINQDAELWQQMWNFHPLQSHKGQMKSPNERWMVGMLGKGC